MLGHTRFYCPSASLVLRLLLKRTWYVLWIGLGTAIAAHLSLSRIAGSAEHQKAAKPLTTQFVKRRPRLTKPLELKKRPQPKRRQMQRRMVAISASAERAGVTFAFQRIVVLRNLAQPCTQLERCAALAYVASGPQVLALHISGTKESAQKVDMSLELLNIDALDTGRYHALVVQDPRDRRNIRGFLHLAVVYSRSMYPPKYPEFEVWIAPVTPRLAQAMNKYTSIRTDVLGQFSLDCAEIFKAPWLYFMAFWPFELTDSELHNLGHYMVSGGFVFADSRYGEPRWRGGALSVNSSILQALSLRGFSLSFEKLPQSHPMYHCYFDFDVPPGAGDTTYPERTSCKQFTYLEGVNLETHLLAVFSRKGYYQPWAAWEGVMKSHNFDNTRPLQFGVNTIIFALTQEGSITHRLMDTIR